MRREAVADWPDVPATPSHTSPAGGASKQITVQSASPCPRETGPEIGQFGWNTEISTFLIDTQTNY